MTAPLAELGDEIPSNRSFATSGPCVPRAASASHCDFSLVSGIHAFDCRQKCCIRTTELESLFCGWHGAYIPNDIQFIDLQLCDIDVDNLAESEDLSQTIWQ